MNNSLSGEGNNWDGIFNFFKPEQADSQEVVPADRKQSKNQTGQAKGDPKRKDSFQGGNTELRELLASCKTSQIEAMAAKSHAEVMERAKTVAQRIIGAAHDRRYFILDKKAESDIVIKQVLAEAEAENKPKDQVLNKLRQREISRV
eukprot:747103-Hanusia_phi.AAC.2